MADVNEAFAAAVSRHQAGDGAAAEAMYRDLLTAFGSHAPTLCNLGVLLVQSGRVEEAVGLYNLALATSSDHPDAHFNLGNVYRRSNQLALAASHYQECLKANPRHASAAYNLGLVFSTVGDMPATVECFRTVVRLEPGNAEGHARLGDAHVRSGRLADGIASFRTASILQPDQPRHLYNLGLALANSGATAEASETITRALKLNPNYAEAHNAMGLNLEAQGRKDDALFHYQKAVQLKPDLADAWSNLGTNLSEQGRCDEAIDCLHESLVHKPNAPAIHSNLLLLLNYTSKIAPEEVAREHFAWAARFAPPVPDAPPIPLPHDRTRRLRVGYLSPDFRQHTVSSFIELLLTHHNRDRVEVFAYGSVLRPDDVTARLSRLADHYRPVGGLPDEQVFELIRADQIDVLIDLAGHTAGNRLQLLAARPAPVQCTLFGYPNTTGLAAVDYRITDPLSDPDDGTESLSAETLLRLPEVPWCYAPPKTDVPVTPLPCLAKKWFTFGCLNNPAKISEACLAAWTKLIISIPGTRLVVLGGQSNAGVKKLTDRFVQGGILRDRVEVISRVPKDKYFEAYHQFDATLDPFPYNGGVTTGDSLWMGVPVLTVAGNTYVSRQGLMANAAVGLPEFVADNADSLIELAKGWTKRRDELATIRAGLRERLLSSPLGDAPRYVRNLETALREVWANRLAAESVLRL